MSDLISRSDAIEAVEQEYKIDRGYMADDYTYGFNQAIQYVSDIILHDLPSAEQVTSKLKNPCDSLLTEKSNDSKEHKSKLESADAEPKWNCTANFVAEQLDRLRNMTDEEKWEFFRKFFGMGDAVHGEWQRVDEQPYFRKHYHKVCCSVCHKQGSEKYNFCPNCGARMKGGTE